MKLESLVGGRAEDARTRTGGKAQKSQGRGDDVRQTACSHRRRRRPPNGLRKRQPQGWIRRNGSLYIDGRRHYLQLWRVEDFILTKRLHM